MILIGIIDLQLFKKKIPVGWGGSCVKQWLSKKKKVHHSIFFISIQGLKMVGMKAF